MTEIRTFDDQSPDLNGASILVTGGTGSFGKRFIRTVMERYSPKRLIVFSRDEFRQYEMAQSFTEEEKKCLRFFIGDVRDVDRLEMALRGVDYVIHAAAIKQVDTAEYNPFECILTNVMGAQNLVQACIRGGIKKVVALSTDKASNPANLYGASKLASDKIFVAANNLSGKNGTEFSVVRYGNVVGSRGSVVPLFERMINEGVKSLPITDDRMTRFWITLQQGVNFVLSSLDIMKGGETFIPKIPSMDVIEVAKLMAPDLETHVIGIRPGEKLHEMMITADDSRNTLEMDDRYIIEPAFKFWERDDVRHPNAKTVEDGFSYASDSNTEWLDAEGLNFMLEQPRT